MCIRYPKRPVAVYLLCGLFVSISGEVEASADWCSSGIKAGEVCCASSCGACGGSGCSGRPGGGSKCCTIGIITNGIECKQTSDDGCVIPPTATRTQACSKGLLKNDLCWVWSSGWSEKGSPKEGWRAPTALEWASRPSWNQMTGYCESDYFGGSDCDIDHAQQYGGVCFCRAKGGCDGQSPHCDLMYVRHEKAFEFAKGSAGSNDCPAGYLHIVSAAGCKSAATALGLSDQSQHDESHVADVRPKGCFEWVGKLAYLNPNPGMPSKPDSNGRPICKKTTTITTTTSTTTTTITTTTTTTLTTIVTTTTTVDTAACPNEVASEEDKLVVQNIDSICSVNVSASEGFSFEVVSNRSRILAVGLRPQTVISKRVPVLPMMSERWIASIHGSKVHIKAETPSPMQSSRFQLRVQAGLLRDSCGRLNAAIVCSHDEFSSIVVWDELYIGLERSDG